MTNDVPPVDDERLPDSAARRIDAACDRFEAAWRGGQAPRIEDFLDLAAEAERPALLRERPKLGGKPQLETFKSDHSRLRHRKAPVAV